MNLTDILSGVTPAPIKEALADYNEFRGNVGAFPATRGRALLAPPSANQKTAKSVRPVFTLSLAPHREAQSIMALPDVTVCPWSTPACRATCVAYAGKGEFPSVRRFRALKTAFAILHPSAFLGILMDDIESAARRVPGGAMRLNTFSDVAWERILPPEAFKALAAYDYTKGGIRRYRAGQEVGYRLVLSVSERTNVASVDQWLAEGATAAVVFGVGRTKALPTEWRGFRVIDGDKTDDRLLDPPSTIIGLRAKGRLNYKSNAESRIFIRGAA